jgi:hypothetical protein
MCLASGCVLFEYTDPKWDETSLGTAPETSDSELNWTRETVISNGLFVSGITTGAASGGCVWAEELRHVDSNDTMVVDVTVYRFKNVQSCLLEWDRIANVFDHPVHMQGRRRGYQYVLSRSSSQRDEWLHMLVNYRDTYAWVRRNRTMVSIDVRTYGAERRADMDNVVRAINKLVGEW